jgi:hypothetical protein
MTYAAATRAETTHDSSTRERQIAKVAATTFTSAYARGPCTAVVQSGSQSASDSGASAGPEITSPVGLKRDP